MITQEMIQEVIQRLVAVYRPERIYLFGSYAWGQPTEDSDLDLMVVVEGEKEVTSLDYASGYEALIGIRCSKDIMINSLAHFQHRVAIGLTLQEKIAKEGRLIYGRA